MPTSVLTLQTTERKHKFRLPSLKRRRTPTSSEESSRNSSLELERDQVQSYSMKRSSSSPQNLPKGWDIAYDKALAESYYVNETENIIQFDSPLEVVKKS